MGKVNEMGLAASQSRLLMLTSRKSDIEGKLMQIANEKLSLARDSAKLSKNYTSALNARQLTWDTSDGNVPLNYNLLMRPNMANSNGQYIITNTTNGRVILDNSYMTTLGLPESGNAGSLISTMSQAMFLQSLLGCTEDSANAYIADTRTIEATESTFTTQYNDANVISNAGLLGLYASTSYPTGSVEGFDGLLRSVAGGLGSQLENSLLGYLGSDHQGDLTNALNYAYEATFYKFACNVNDTDSTNGVTAIGSTSLSSSGSSGTNRLTSGYNVDGRQLINTFLSYFDLYCAQHFGGVYNSSVSSNSTVRSVTGSGGTGTETTDFMSDNAAGVDTTVDINNNNLSDIYEAHYYLNLYNAINTYGWESGTTVQNKGNLEDQIQIGAMSLRQMQTDGSWTITSTSDYDCPLRSKSDNEAISKAEVEYTAEKDKLAVKEQKLDLNKERLDTERTSIDTEVESIQNVIKKNIERSFKIFNA
jgi:hypothetical protein